MARAFCTGLLFALIVILLGFTNIKVIGWALIIGMCLEGYIRISSRSRINE